MVQAPPAPPGPTSAGSPKAPTLPTSPDVCSSLQPLHRSVRTFGDVSGVSSVRTFGHVSGSKNEHAKSEMHYTGSPHPVVIYPSPFTPSIIFEFPSMSSSRGHSLSLRVYIYVPHFLPSTSGQPLRERSSFSMTFPAWYQTISQYTVSLSR